MDVQTKIKQVEDKQHLSDNQLATLLSATPDIIKQVKAGNGSLNDSQIAKLDVLLNSKDTPIDFWSFIGNKWWVILVIIGALWWLIASIH